MHLQSKRPRAAFSVLAIRLALAAGAVLVPLGAASASDVRSVTADDYGNAVIRTEGGAKIIAVGQAALAETFDAGQAEEPVVIGVAERALPAAACREVGIILKGRSHMYGVSAGDPVPRATRIICD